LRHYERVGVLAKPPRTNGGYRDYPPAALERARLVRGALSVGFSLQEIARVLRIRDQGGAPCREVRDLAASKLEKINRHLEELTLVRDQIQMMLNVWDDRLARRSQNERLGLLESLSLTHKRTL
jgi:DNA-binding transcriptional MerR regulator